ncbi:GntR family transcriptional regulator [Rhodobacterales bacterium]|nr:GntR family transcriptional regulator [Rhodobacterales bacterium]
MSETRVETLYARVKDMAVSFKLRPGERINEVSLARELNASRTPLREALNRLVTEQLLSFQAGKGFFCRALDAQSVFDLYELRASLEVLSVQLACERASDEGIAELKENEFVDGMLYAGRTIGEAGAGDEAFHVSIARLSGNSELVTQLERINERTRFIRWVAMAEAVVRTKGEHQVIMNALEARDAVKAAEVMRGHVMRRMDQIVAAVREGFSNIYVSGPEEIFERKLAGEELTQ